MKFGPSVHQGGRSGASKSEKQKKKSWQKSDVCRQSGGEKQCKNSQTDRPAAEMGSVTGYRWSSKALDGDAWDDHTEEEHTQYPDLEDIDDAELEVLNSRRY